MGDRTSLTLYEGMSRIMENVFINVKNRSHVITAEIEIPKDGGEGVIICQGGKFAEWSLYMKDGKLAYVHNWFGGELYTVKSPEKLAPKDAATTPAPRSVSILVLVRRSSQSFISQIAALPSMALDPVIPARMTGSAATPAF